MSCRRSSTKSANDIEVEKLGPVLRAAGRSEGATGGRHPDAVYAELAAKRPTNSTLGEEVRLITYIGLACCGRRTSS
jgi:hypothetical protein